MKYELIYQSIANENNTQQDIIDIVKKSMESNPARNITGCLFAYKNEFLQILEGEKEEVLALYSKISVDKRHIGPIVLHQGEITESLFPGWNMAFHDMPVSDVSQKYNLMGLKEFEKFLSTIQSPTLAKKLFVNVSKTIIQPAH